jgi:hypothetical protein
VIEREDLLEARVGFEPTNGGFADLSLGPLGYRAQCPPVYRKAAEYVSQASLSIKKRTAQIRISRRGIYAADVAAT